MSDNRFVNAGLVGIEGLADRVTAEVIGAFNLSEIPLEAYLDLDRAPGEPLPTVGAEEPEHEIAALARRNISLYLIATRSHQVAPLIGRILEHSTVRPLVFVVTAECHPLQLRALRKVREAHRGVSFVFRRDLRCCIPTEAPIEPASAINVRHRPDATESQLHSLIDYGLFLAAARPRHWAVEHGRFEMSFAGSRPTRRLALTPDPTLHEDFIVELTDAMGTLSLSPDIAPQALDALRWLLWHADNLLENMRSGDDRNAVDSYVARHRVADTESELIAAEMVQRRSLLLADPGGPGQA